MPTTKPTLTTTAATATTRNRAIAPTHNLTKSLLAFSFAAFLALTATAQIASGTTGIDATGNSVSEMAACNNGSSQESRQTCMTEVRNANAAKRAGQVDNANGQFDLNAMKRCDALTGQDKLACQARIVGFGTTSGSVAGGGVVREIEVLVPAQPTPPAAQPTTQAMPPVVK